MKDTFFSCLVVFSCETVGACSLCFVNSLYFLENPRESASGRLDNRSESFPKAEVSRSLEVFPLLGVLSVGPAGS